MSIVKKNIRKNSEQNGINRSYKAQLNTMRKKFLALINDKKTEEAKVLCENIASMARKLVNKGIIHKNKMSNIQSSVSKKLNINIE